MRIDLNDFDTNWQIAPFVNELLLNSQDQSHEIGCVQTGVIP